MPQIVTIWLPMLKHLLIRFLILELLWESQILIQIIAMLDLGKALIIQEQKATTVSLNI